MKVPFLNLKRLNLRYEKVFQNQLNETLNNGFFLLGEKTKIFESKFAKYCQTDQCVTVGSGLDALEFILRGYGIGKNDDVLVSSHTFIATWLSIVRTGANPVPVEPRQDGFNIDSQKIENFITSNTKAIVVAHMYGEPCDIGSIKELSTKYGLKLIEDAAQCHGGEYKGDRVGSLGDAAAFSFYPGKNLGALGDGGAVTSDDQELINTIRLQRNYGSSVKYRHECQGGNSRLDEIQAAFLSVKIEELDELNAKRSEIAQSYIQGIDHTYIKLPKNLTDIKNVWHLFVLRTPFRNELQEYLTKSGVGNLIHYPTAIHKQKAFKDLKIDYALPITENLADTVLSIPMDPLMDELEISYVIEVLNNWKPMC